MPRRVSPCKPQKPVGRSELEVWGPCIALRSCWGNIILRSSLKFTQEPQNLSSHDAKEMCLVIFFAYAFVGAKDGYLKLHSWCPCWQKDTHADRLRTTSTSSDKREATCTARISACVGRQDRMISSNHAEGSWCQCLLEELEAMNLPISRHCHWLISAEFKHHLKALSIQLRGYTSSISLRLGEAAPALKTIKGFRLHGTMVKADLKCWTQKSP